MTTGVERRGMPNESVPLYRTLIGLGVVCSALIAMVYDFTEPTIRQQRAEALEEAIFSLWPQGRVTQTLATIGSEGLSSVQAGAPSDDVVHGVYDGDRRLLGFAVVASGMGYQDRIRLLYAYDPRQQSIAGFRVLESRETPGLGDRIGYDGAFIANFAALPMSLDDQGRLAHELVAVKPGVNAESWQIDTISGATVSSRAVVDILNRSAQRWLTVLRDQVSDSE